MTGSNQSDDSVWLLLGVIAAVVLMGMLAAFVVRLNEFSRELKLLNTEIGRTEGAERRRWLRRRKRLWLSLIPFIKY